MESSIATHVAAGLIALTAIFSPARAAELVMVEERGCHWCARWNEDIAPIYPKTAEGKAAPLRRIDISIRHPEDFSYTRRVAYTPTFVLIAEGKELGRIEGYPGEDFFWALLEKLLNDNDIQLEDD